MARQGARPGESRSVFALGVTPIRPVFLSSPSVLTNCLTSLQTGSKIDPIHGVVGTGLRQASEQKGVCGFSGGGLSISRHA